MFWLKLVSLTYTRAATGSVLEVSRSVQRSRQVRHRAAGEKYSLEMGDALCSWRARIGSFHDRLRAVKMRHCGRISVNYGTVIFLAFLLLIGGVEPNPGPTLDDIYALMQESKERMDLGFKEVNEKMVGMEKGLREQLEKQEEKIVKLEEENSNLREIVKKLEDKQDDLENRSRRNNLIFFGIDDPIDSKETWNDCAKKIIHVVQNEMKLEHITENDIERAHRLGNRRGKRPIIVKFHNFQAKNEVLGCRASLKGSNIFINEDFSRKVRQEREVLISEMKKAREKGITATVSYNKLRADGKTFIYSWEQDRVVEVSNRHEQEIEEGRQRTPEQPLKMVTRQKKKIGDKETPAKSAGRGLDYWLRKRNDSSRGGRGGK